MWDDFINLFYPKQCLSCGRALFSNEIHICYSCVDKLPRTGWYHESDNPIERIFYGKIKIEAASAFLYFSKYGSVQVLMHALKYKGKKQIGYKLGNLFGNEIKESYKFKSIDCIVPVPLHPIRQKHRGYNQSEQFALGIAEVLDIPVNTELLIRKKQNESQTKKNRMERFDNISGLFELLEANEKYIGKHFLLVDDVITTGATIEACANKLLAIEGSKITVASIASA